MASERSREIRRRRHRKEVRRKLRAKQAAAAGQTPPRRS
jgi:hypothetical protein